MLHRLLSSLIIFVFSTNLAPAQIDLVDGIEWEYLAFNYLSGEVYDYKNRIDGDTLINDIPCKKLKRESFNCNQRYYSEEYVYVEDDKLYYYHSEDSLFQMLYDFNPNVGDTIEIRFWGYYLNNFSHFYLKVDSVKQVNFNGKLLNEVYTELGRDDGVNGVQFENYFYKYLEGIGTNINFFYFTDTGFCDGRHVTELFCYYHPEHGNLIFNPEKCNAIVATNEIEEELKIEVFPNPATDFLFVEIENKAFYHFDLQFFTTTGQLIYQTSIQNNTPKKIDISHFPSGIFHYVITNLDNRQKGFGKIICMELKF